MPVYLFTARDQRGSVQSGSLEALNEEEVLGILQHRGFFITSISQKTVEAHSSAVATKAARRRRMHTRVKTDDQVLLCQQLATLVEAGVPLIRSIDVVMAQVESRVLLIALDEIRRDIESGRTFRESLAKHPKLFNNLWLNLVETGETSGHLAQSLRQLASHFEAAQKLENEAKTAMTYPAFLMVAAIGVVAFFMYFIIPKFTSVFTQMGMELPLITKIVIGMSDFARRYWILIIIGNIAAFVAIRWYLGTAAGKWMLDRAVLKVPLFSTLFTYIQLAEFNRGLATLLESGVPLLSGLEILGNGATNRVYGQAILEIRERVKEGKPMAQPMADCGIFPPMAVQMVLVGEEVGELGKMVNRIAKYYEERVEMFITRMTRLFEPIAIVVMGAVVLFIVLSIFMPMFKMSTQMRGG